MNFMQSQNYLKSNIESIQNTQMAMMNVLQTLQESVMSTKKDMSLLSSKISSRDDYNAFNEEDKKNLERNVETGKIYPAIRLRLRWIEQLRRTGMKPGRNEELYLLPKHH